MTRGKHIKVIAHGSAELMNSELAMHQCLNAIVIRIGMRELGRCIYRVENEVTRQDRHDDEGGVTGVLVISTSHIAIHTWPEYSKLVADVYSCRPFLGRDVLELLQHYYGIHTYTASDLTDALCNPDTSIHEPWTFVARK